MPFGIELTSLKGVKAPRGMGGFFKNLYRKHWAVDVQVVGPAGSGVTSFLLQLVQQGITDEEIEKNYKDGERFCSQVQYGGVIRKLGLRDVVVVDVEDQDDVCDRFDAFRLDWIDRKPMGVVWVAPGKPEILKDKGERPEYELFRRYVQFLMSKTYPVPGGEARKPQPKFLVVVINHMDIYERMWSVNWLNFLHYYRSALAYVRRKHQKVKVLTIPCCAWAGINVREPLMELLMSIEVEG